MKFKTIKLGTVCTDKATEEQGTLTHLVFYMGHGIEYLFQPTGLNSEDGHPVRKLQLEEARLLVFPQDYEEIDIPVDILGTTLRNKASGFEGMATHFIYHVNGCFHVAIQPKGRLPKTNAIIRFGEFDLRECTGEKLEELSAAKLAESRQQTPSPYGECISDFRQVHE
jgi:hypothetical protein